MLVFHGWNSLYKTKIRDVKAFLETLSPSSQWSSVEFYLCYHKEAEGVEWGQATFPTTQAEKVSFYWNIRVYRKFCLKIEPHYFTWHFKCFVSFLKHKMQKLHKLKPSLHLDMWALVMTSSFLFPNCHSENHTLGFKTMQVLCACLGQSVAK